MESQFEYRKSHRFFAQVGRNLENIAGEEVQALGAQQVEPQKAGIYFKADLDGLYRINHNSRLVSRVLAPLHTFSCRDEDELYRQASQIEWERLFSPNQTFAVYAALIDSPLGHSRYAALKIKDAIVDRFREIRGIRPSVNREEPDVVIHLLSRDSMSTISLDCSGGSLHRRGYRLEGGKAPLQETLAAAVIRLSGWQGGTPFLDPMCGSGTLLAEAMMAYCRIPAGILRTRFGFQYLPDFDADLWRKVREESALAIRTLTPGLITGSDIHLTAVRSARANLSRLPYGRHIRIEKMDFRAHPGLEKGTIISNLPYGVRIGDQEKLKILYQDFGDFLKQRCQGSTAYLLTGNLDLISCIGLKPSRRIPLFNGPIECRLLKFEIY